MENELLLALLLNSGLEAVIPILANRLERTGSPIVVYEILAESSHRFLEPRVDNGPAANPYPSADIQYGCPLLFTGHIGWPASTSAQQRFKRHFVDTCPMRICPHGRLGSACRSLWR